MITKPLQRVFSLLFLFWSVFLVGMVVVSSPVFGAPAAGSANKATDGGAPVIALGNFKNLDQWKGATPQTLIGRYVAAVVGVVGSIALALFVYGGILWMTSAGNSERQKKGMLILVWAALGSIAVLSSYALVTFILDILK